MLSLALLAALSGVASIVATRLALAWLRQKQILDRPNDRSSHTIPTPRGGGLAVTPVVVGAWAMVGIWQGSGGGLWLVLAATLGLFSLSWIDDRISLPARLRFGAHLLAAGLGLAMLGSEQLIFQGLLPFWADRLVALLAWTWFINLTNFMDGIDGISGIEIGSVSLGFGLLAALAGQGDLLPWSVALAAVAAGFLVWNWHPAKLFLGDSGSVPLGYLLGWLLLQGAARGLWAPALILPLYYLVDATLTLSRRALRGEKIWQAHRQHFYQRAAARWGRHDGVALGVLGCNLALFAAVWLLPPWIALGVAVVIVAAFLTILGGLGQKGA